MVLKQVELSNFRLHRSTSLSFSDKLNLIIGGNGQGKTSILEAIYYLCTTKNLNLASEKDVVTFGEQFFEVAGSFSDISNNKTRIFFDNILNKKNFFLDDKQVFRSADIYGKFPIVILIQSDHAITLGAPSERRRFVDSVLSQASHSYLEILLEYNKTLRQRASLLSLLKETNDKNLYSQLDAWTETLIENGSEIIKQRVNFVNEFNVYMDQTYDKVIDKLEVPRIVYNTLCDMDEENTKQKFNDAIASAREEEKRKCTNLVGPHRDDFIFHINELELKRFGSQGQHKTFQVVLRFAQFFYIKDKLGKTPIFLMDDVFGELDFFRAEKISEYLSEVGQTFITTTDFTRMEELNLIKENRIIKVEHGKTSYA
ncbi:MAG: DNA replication and repair protein RecF [Ignavibacteria bacterium]|nr:DNA replication and repair protein RecF [Ignavibacteria bacterium]